MASDEPPNDSPATLATLVPMKWRGQHFHTICMGSVDEDGALLMIFNRNFPADNPYKDGTGIEYALPKDALKEVNAPDYRYLCTVLIDLDRMQ